MRVDKVDSCGDYIRSLEIHFEKADTVLEVFTANDIVEGIIVRDTKSGRFVGFGVCDRTRTVITKDMENRLGGILVADGRIRATFEGPLMFATPHTHVSLRMTSHKKLQAIVGIALSQSSAEQSYSDTCMAYTLPKKFAIRIWYDGPVRGIEFHRVRKCISHGFGYCSRETRVSKWYTNENPPSCLSHLYSSKSLPIYITSSKSAAYLVIKTDTYGDRREVDRSKHAKQVIYLTPGREYSFKLHDGQGILEKLIP
jgi:hypothetical protein